MYGFRPCRYCADQCLIDYCSENNKGYKKTVAMASWCHSLAKNCGLFEAELAEFLGRDPILILEEIRLWLSGVDGFGFRSVVVYPGRHDDLIERTYRIIIRALLMTRIFVAEERRLRQSLHDNTL